MRNECDIVEDLLFSYNDGVLSNSSKELVDEHLKKCEKCKKKLEEIIQENNEHNQKNQITKRNVIILVFFIILMLVVLFNIHVYNNYKEIASTMEIYLKDDITEQQIENIKNKIIEESDNTEIEYVSKEKALERFKNNLEKNENLLNDFDNQNNPIPASIEIKTDTKIQTIVESIQDMQGIAHITTHINSNPYELFIQRVMKK